MKLFFVAIGLPFLFFGMNSQASSFEGVPEGIRVQQVLTMTSNADNYKYVLHTMIDKNGEAVGMYKLEDRGKGGQLHDIFWMRDLESEEGVVLLNRSDRNAILLNGSLDRETKEGQFVLRYLTNGITMSYEKCTIDLKYDKSGWYIQNATSGERVQQAFVETYFLGIKKIQGLCQ